MKHTPELAVVIPVFNEAELPSIHLLGGRSLPLRDESYREIDEFITPAGSAILHYLIATKHLDLTYTRIAAGHNMATRATSYTEVDGFPLTSIAEADEDVVYTKRIAKEFGFQALRLDPEMRVRTSVRRISQAGAIRTALHYLGVLDRSKYADSIDIRDQPKL